MSESMERNIFVLNATTKEEVDQNDKVKMTAPKTIQINKFLLNVNNTHHMPPAITILHQPQNGKR